MSRTHLVTSLLVLNVLLAGSSAWAESPSVLLEKGIHLEETVGDLDHAIAVYEQIISDAQANRRYVAQAYLRLGCCQLKKGDNAGAVRAFEAILSRFGDQRAARSAAQKELSELRAAALRPPVVTGSTPATYADDVSPMLKQVTVTFDQAMQDGSWSWTGEGETYPDTTGHPNYDAGRTVCTLPVKLEPGTVYRVGINGPSRQDFKSVKGVPAPRHVLVFATKGADGKPTAIPEAMLAEAKAINDLVLLPVPDGRQLLDAETLAGVSSCDNEFASLFQPEKEYEAASAAERESMVKRWIADAASSDLKISTRAIAALGNIQAKSAAGTLIAIANEPMSNNRPRWMAVRGLERIGDPEAVPTLIKLVDHGSKDTQLYARAALATITGVYFGEDKEAWRAWWGEHGSTSRPRRFVKLVLGEDRMTFRGEDIQWGELPDLLERVPDRHQTVLEVAVAGDVPAGRLMEALGLATTHGLEYGSYIGEAELGAMDAPTQQVPATPSVSPETLKAQLINWVEDFFSRNYRDITARKTLEWGEPESTASGNLSIRYKCLATIWHKDEMILEKRFTFSPQGEFISAENVETYPADTPPAGE